MAPRIRRGDTVMVIAGKDKGKKGKVERVYPARSRILVDGINVVKRHVKPTQQVMQGGIVEAPAPIHLSNVMLVCRRCSKPTRIGIERTADGGRSRVCKQCGRTIDG